MPRRPASWFDGMGSSVGLAIVMFVYALLVALDVTGVVDRITEASLVGVPVAGGVLVLMAGLTRRGRWARLQKRRAAHGEVGASFDEIRWRPPW